MKIVIAGGTGFIGRELSTFLLSQNHEVVILSRREGNQPGLKTIVWDGKTQGPWVSALEGAEAVVNLCGETVARPWTKSYKDRLVQSRVLSTRALGEAFRSLSKPPKVLVNASAIGFYGDRGDEALDEASLQGEGFLAQLCSDWEAEARKCEASGVRVVCLRLGLVLGQGGALERMVPPFKLGFGGPLGSGRQWTSWISRTDLARIAAHLIQNDVSGPVNAVSPNPLRGKDFAAALGKALGRPSWLPAPAWALRLAMGEMAKEVILPSQKVFPKRALDSGFSYQQPDIDSALRVALK